MEESLILSNIKNTLSLEKSVTYSSLQNTFNVSPLESQLLLKKYINENKDSIATYLNHLTEDNVNHVLVISDCSLSNNSILSLKNVETNDDNHIDLYMTHNDLDKRNPPIVSEEIYILSNTQPMQVNLEPPVKQEQTIKRNVVHQSTSKLTNSKSSTSIKKFTNSTKENKATKITTSFFSKNPVHESSSTPKVLLNDDSDIEFSDNDSLVVPATQQVSPPRTISSTCKKMASKELEVITFNDLTHTDNIAVGSNKLSKDTASKDSTTKSRLFENFENVSPKKSKSKRRRLVIESDDDDDEEEEDENDKVLVEASFEEPKRVKHLKSHPSKRFKIDNNDSNNQYNDKPKHDEPDRVEKKKQVIETTSKPGWKKVERTYKDEDGYLVVEKVFVPINSEDNNSVKSIRADKVEIAKSEISVKPERRIGRKSQAKQIDSKRKQTNIMNFFQKN